MWNASDDYRFCFEVIAADDGDYTRAHWPVAARVGAIANVTSSIKAGAGFERRAAARGTQNVVLAGLTFGW